MNRTKLAEEIFDAMMDPYSFNVSSSPVSDLIANSRDKVQMKNASPPTFAHFDET